MAGYFKPCYRFSFIKDCTTGAQVLPTKFLCKTHSTSVLWERATGGNAALSAEGAWTAGQKARVCREDSCRLAAGSQESPCELLATSYGFPALGL